MTKYNIEPFTWENPSHPDWIEPVMYNKLKKFTLPPVTNLQAIYRSQQCSRRKKKLRSDKVLNKLIRYEKVSKLLLD